MNKITKIFLALLLITFTNCEDPWSKHISGGDSASAEFNLLEIINNTTELSLFGELIKKSGLSNEFQTPGNYTVWAPNNDALASLSQNIINDSVALKMFINNYISSGNFPQDSKQDDIRCQMMNGKHVNINMSTPTIEDEIITGTFNNLATNGIVHIINQKIELRSNIWEYLEINNSTLKESIFLNSLTDSVFDSENAEILGYNDNGEAIYDTISGMIWYNEFLMEHADLRDEDSLFTFILLQDDVFDLHNSRFAPYYKLKATDPRDTLTFAKYMVCYDLVGSGIQDAATNGGYMKSISNKSIPLNSAAITNTIKLSNGVIYVVNDCDLSLETKFPPIIIEGEDENKTIYIDGGRTGYTRINKLAHGGYDFVLDDHEANPARIVYNVGDIAATTYEFYWVAVDDFNSTYYGSVDNDMISQKIEKVIYIEGASDDNQFPVHQSISDSLMWVTDTTYEMATEHLVGIKTFSYYEDLWIHLIGSGDNTTLTLDYIKLKPVFD